MANLEYQKRNEKKIALQFNVVHCTIWCNPFGNRTEYILVQCTYIIKNELVSFKDEVEQTKRNSKAIELNKA